MPPGLGKQDVVQSKPVVAPSGAIAKLGLPLASEAEPPERRLSQRTRPKMLTLTVTEKAAAKQGQFSEKSAKRRGEVRDLHGGVEVAMGTQTSGSFFYWSGYTDVAIDWRVVREGETERGVAAAQLDSFEPVSLLAPSPDAVPISSCASNSSSTTPRPSPFGISSPKSSSSGNPRRLQIRHRRLVKVDKRQSRLGKEDDKGGQEAGKEAEGGSHYVSYPSANIAEERRLLREREKQAKDEYSQKIDQLNEAIRNNHLELERLTNDEKADDDEMYALTKERQFLKKQIKKYVSEDAEVRYELRGEDVWYEVGLGCSVLLEELPGRPRVVWSVERGRCDCLRSLWQSSHSVPYTGGYMPGEIDVLQLEYVRSIGHRGKKLGGMAGVRGIAADREHVFVANCHKNCISVYSRRTGAHVRSWGGSEGRGTMEFQGPRGLALDKTNVFVADLFNHRVQVFSKSGAYVRTIGGRHAGEEARLICPIGVAVDNEHVVVSSYNGHYISLFDKVSGDCLRRMGGKGTAMGSFNHPHGVALDSQHIYVADCYNSRVQVLSVEGEFVRVIGDNGAGPGQLSCPCGVAVDTDYLYVCDYSNNRIIVFRKQGGEFVRSLEQDAADSLEAVGPFHIALHAEHAFVTDCRNDRVLVFRG